MELEKYIKKTKEIINDAYFYIQDTLIEYDESLKNLKNKGWNTDETAYRQEYQKIVDNFNQKTTSMVENCKRLIQEQKESYMKEVDEFYRSDGSRIDLNFMNLIKAEIPLTAKEITDVVEKNKENLTMLRVINKYLLETNQHLPEHKRIVLDTRMRDFYDVYEIMNSKADQISFDVLKKAFAATCMKRETSFGEEEVRETLDKIKDDSGLEEMWNRFKRVNYFVDDLSWGEVSETIVDNIEKIFFLATRFLESVMKRE